MDALIEKGAALNVYDPEAMPHIKKRYGDKLTYKGSMYEALEDADALIICTEWSIFRTPDFNKMRRILNEPVIFDGRNLYNIDDMETEGLSYISIGRRSVINNDSQ
jgi:UDPglucose 6-dehydrogenase